MESFAVIFLQISLLEGIVNLIAFSVIIIILAITLFYVAKNMLDKQQKLLKVFKHKKDQKGKIKSNEHEELPGIPFFVKTEIFSQKTTYLEPLISLKISFKVLKNNEIDDEKKLEKLVAITENNKNIIEILEKKIAEELPEIKELDKYYEWLATWKTKFNEIIEYRPKSFSSIIFNEDFILEENTILRKQIVDYGNRYFVNQMQPIIGSAEFNIEIAPDGTLTKSAAKSDDKTIETIVGHLPSELFGSLTGSKTTDLGQTENEKQDAVAKLNMYIKDPDNRQEEFDLEDLLGDFLKQNATVYKFEGTFGKELFYLRHILKQRVDDMKPKNPLEPPFLKVGEATINASEYTSALAKERLTKLELEQTQNKKLLGQYNDVFNSIKNNHQMANSSSIKAFIFGQIQETKKVQKLIDEEVANAIKSKNEAEDAVSAAKEAYLSSQRTSTSFVESRHEHSHIDYQIEFVGKLSGISPKKTEEKPNLTIGLKSIETNKKE